MFDQLSLLSTIHSAPLCMYVVLVLIFLGLTAIYSVAAETLFRKLLK